MAEGSRVDRAQALLHELQERGEARSRRVREMVGRSVRARREFVRLVRKEIRRQMVARNTPSPTGESVRTPSTSKS